LHFLTNINEVEVGQHALVSVKAAVHVEFILVNNCGMVGSRWNVFSFYFDFGPSSIEGVLQLSLHYYIRRLSIDQASLFFMAVLSDFHKRYTK
jgi:hypothetical protein